MATGWPSCGTASSPPALRDERLTQSQTGESRVTVLQVADGRDRSEWEPNGVVYRRGIFRGAVPQHPPCTVRAFTPCAPHRRCAWV